MSVIAPITECKVVELERNLWGYYASANFSFFLAGTHRFIAYYFFRRVLVFRRMFHAPSAFTCNERSAAFLMWVGGYDVMSPPIKINRLIRSRGLVEKNKTLSSCYNCSDFTDGSIIDEETILQCHMCVSTVCASIDLLLFRYCSESSLCWRYL